MNEREFCYWLQGYVELCGKQPTAVQWASVKDHLKLVFKKKTPERRVGPLDDTIFCAPADDGRLC